MDEATIGAPSGVSGAADPIIVALCAACVVTVLRIPLLFRELAVTNDHSRGTIDVLGHLREGVVGLRPAVWCGGSRS